MPFGEMTALWYQTYTDIDTDCTEEMHRTGMNDTLQELLLKSMSKVCNLH